MPRKLGVVLGAGGTVGLAYEAGVMKALQELGGIDVATADLLVGTSAGSIMASHLRSGWTVDDLWRSAKGLAPSLLGDSPEEVAEFRATMLDRSVTTPFDVLFRGLGSAWVLSRSIVRWPLPQVPAMLGRLFPGGMMSMGRTEELMGRSLPYDWPEGELYLVAVDTVSGRRVVFGRPGSPTTDLHHAVLASCAVPGVFPPVRVGRRVLVDGGVASTTHLDLAVKGGCDVAIVVAPMGYDPADPPPQLQQVVRRIPNRWVEREAAYARARGVQTVVLRPSAPDVALAGVNFLRKDRWLDMAESAFESTARTLARDDVKAVLDGVGVPRRRGRQPKAPPAEAGGTP